MSETIGGTTTKFLVDSLNPTKLPQVMDETVNGAVTRTYAYGLNRISENQLINGIWTPSFYGYDGHGNVRFLASSAGAVTDTYTFDAFGNVINSTGSTPNNFLFSGELYDNSTSMYQLRARWYQPTTGRFITTDPMEHKSCCNCLGSCGPQSCSPLQSNPYVYADDDPVNRIDPTGRAAILEYEVLVSKNEAQKPAIIRYADTAYCLDLLLAELQWCALYSTNELQFWVCTQKAHLNYQRCLWGLPLI